MGRTNSPNKNKTAHKGRNTCKDTPKCERCVRLQYQECLQYSSYYSNLTVPFQMNGRS